MSDLNTAFSVDDLEVNDEATYDIRLRGMDVKRLVQLIMDNAESQDGEIRRAYRPVPRDEPFHNLVQDDGNVDDLVHNEVLLWALQESEAQEKIRLRRNTRWDIEVWYEPPNWDRLKWMKGECPAWEQMDKQTFIDKDKALLFWESTMRDVRRHNEKRHKYKDNGESFAAWKMGAEWKEVETWS